MGPDRAAIAVDAGGTFLKCCVVGPDGREAPGSFVHADAASEGSRNGILEGFGTVVCSAMEAIRRLGLVPAGIGIAIPGPFDFAAGKSLMRHKFAAIHGVELRPDLRLRCRLPEELPMVFLHDTHAFLLGEARQGAGKGVRRVAGLTLGTGLGLGCMIDGRFLDNGAGSPHVSLWKMPYGRSILEDVASRRGIIAEYRARSGTAEDLDVAEIAARARHRSDPHAAEAFRAAARGLVECLPGILAECGTECLVVGGQIAKAYGLMEEELGALRARLPTLRSILPARNIDLAPLLGAAQAVLER